MMSKRVVKRRGAVRFISARAWVWAFHPLRGAGHKGTTIRMLCSWAEPSRESLLARAGSHPPTEDAIPVRVWIVRELPPKRKARRP